MAAVARRCGVAPVARRCGVAAVARRCGVAVFVQRRLALPRCQRPLGRFAALVDDFGLRFDERGEVELRAEKKLLRANLAVAIVARAVRIAG